MPDTTTTVRLQKYLARAGVASRRKCEDLIRAGKVQVNGKTTKEPYHPVAVGVDEVRIEGALLRPAKAVYYKLYKPVGYLTAMGEEGDATLDQLLPPEITRVFPVGRLDFDASGLVLLTNDGDLANWLLHPRYHVPKVYRVEVRPCPHRAALTKLDKGILIDGTKTKPSSWKLLDRTAGHGGVIEVTLTEGRKNQIKRMANAVGSEVTALHRASFGPILLGHLKPGALKKLAEGEVAALKRLADKARLDLQGAPDDEGDEEI